jgi:hypothetical protein
MATKADRGQRLYSLSLVFVVERRHCELPARFINKNDYWTDVRSRESVRLRTFQVRFGQTIPSGRPLLGRCCFETGPNETKAEANKKLQSKDDVIVFSHGSGFQQTRRRNSVV